MVVSRVLNENIEALEKTFADCGDLVKRKMPIGKINSTETSSAETSPQTEVDIYIIYIDMMADRLMIEGSVLTRLMILAKDLPLQLEKLRDNVFDALRDKGLTTADIKEVTDFEEINLGILSGDTILFIDGFEKAILISTKGWPNRGIQSAETEVVVQGSKEAFTEGFRFNTVLVRRRIRDTRLKVKQLQIGRRSQTDVALMYLDDVVRKDILKEAEERLHKIDIDAILDSGYVEQFLEDDWLSPFPQAQITERPDKAAAAILEGRIVIIVDNSPFVLIIPSTLNTFFQASEDYYQRWQIASFVRLIRYGAGAISIFLPGLYLAIAVFHPSMLPMLLIFKMSGARQTVPFPAVVEILIMELTFELLREAGIRLPGPVGSTLGIVGGLIIGQAAVEAGLVSPIVVIVVALTGIASFAIPHVSLVTGFRLMKYVVIFFSATLGLFGFWLSLFLILIHLASLKSFGIPYLDPFAGSSRSGLAQLRDSVLRFPLFMMRKRPFFSNPKEKNRR